MKILLIALGVVFALVAGVFGLVIGAVLLLAFMLLSFLGKGRVNVAVNRGPRPATARPPPPSTGAGDVIDIEATKVESPRELQ